MTVTVMWAVKGGSGTTTVAAATAITAAGETLLVDVDGDLPAVLGLPEPTGDGISEWLASTADPAVLDPLTVEVTATTRMLPRGRQPIHGDHPRLTDLAHWLHRLPGDVVIDAGTRQQTPRLVDTADRALLVTRPCYLALRRAVSVPCRPTGIVVVREPGRALRAADIERAVGVPVVAEIHTDPAVARAIDAGLLAARIPTSLRNNLQPPNPSPANVPAPSNDTAPADVAHHIVQHWQHQPGPPQEPPPLDIA